MSVSLALCKRPFILVSWFSPAEPQTRMSSTMDILHFTLVLTIGPQYANGHSFKILVINIVELLSKEDSSKSFRFQYSTILKILVVCKTT